MPNILDLKTFTDERGNLTVVEKVLPFEIKRVFLYMVWMTHRVVITVTNRLYRRQSVLKGVAGYLFKVVKMNQYSILPSINHLNAWLFNQRIIIGWIYLQKIAY